MLFNSYVFILLFLPFTVFAYSCLKQAGKYTQSIVLLTLASLFFYGWWNPAYLILILASIVGNYAVGTYLCQQEASPQRKRMLLVAAVTVNLAVLAYFKYLVFFAGVVSAFGDFDWRVDAIVLPLAISFFTFQQIAYLVDAYRGETSHYGFLDYCLFVTFFPQLIAGPIVHHNDMMPQFVEQKNRLPHMENIAVGLAIFSIGLFKKVVIADNAGAISTPLFAMADAGSQLTLLESWLAAIGYTLQLYYDFSGYADMAVGAARMFGIRLPINFNSPYKSRSIIEFWRRWHISLSNFLRDYLYFALGGNRKGTARRFSNLFITMLLGGLWHGAGWTFVAWGGLHGCYLIINHAARALLKSWHGRRRRGFGCISRVLTLLCVVIGWVFFRAETLSGALTLLRGMVGMNGVALPPKYLGRWGDFSAWLQDAGVNFYDMQHFSSLQDVWRLTFLLLLTLSLPNTYQLFARYQPVIGAVDPSRWQLTLNNKTGILFGLLMLYCLLSMNKVSEFLYFQF